jgi:hypothetical protein
MVRRETSFGHVPLPGSRELLRALMPLRTKLVALPLLDIGVAAEPKEPKGVRFHGPRRSTGRVGAHLDAN